MLLYVALRFKRHPLAKRRYFGGRALMHAYLTEGGCPMEGGGASFRPNGGVNVNYTLAG